MTITIGLRLPSRNRADHQERFLTCGDRLRQRLVRQFVRNVLLASEEPDEWAPLSGHMITDCSSKHGEAFLERVDNRALGRLAIHYEAHFAVNMRERSEMRR
jgi:hypothetical protein